MSTEASPALHEMGEVVANGLGASLDGSFTALDRIVRNHGGHRHAKVAANAGQFILVSQEAATASGPSSDVVEQFAVQTCAAIVEHKFFGNARQHMVTEGKLPSHAGAYDWQRPNRRDQRACDTEDCQAATRESERRTSTGAEGVLPRRSPPALSSTKTCAHGSAIPHPGEAAAVSTELYTHDFTVHSRDVGLHSTCWMNGEHLSRHSAKCCLRVQPT